MLINVCVEFNIKYILVVAKRTPSVIPIMSEDKRGNSEGSSVGWLWIAAVLQLAVSAVWWRGRRLATY
jgi:hypothetical protein